MIRFKTYKNNDTQINFQDLTISKENLLSFFEFLKNPSKNSVVEFTVEKPDGNQSEYKITNESSIQIFKDGNLLSSTNFFQLLSNEFSIDLNPELLSTRFIQISNPTSQSLKDVVLGLTPISVNQELAKNIQLNKAQLDELTKKIEAGMTPDQKDKSARLNELNSRLASIQAQIDSFQGEKKNKEAINNNIKKFNTEKTSLAQMLESVELLIKTRDDLKQKIQSFSNVTPELQKVQELKQKKLQFQNSQLFQSKPISILDNQVEDEVKNKLFDFKINPILVLLFLNIAISIIAFMYSFSFSVLTTGVVSTVILMITYIVSRFFNDSLENLNEDQDIQTESKSVNIANPLVQEDPNSQLFINTAWSNALTNELNTLEQNIQKNLNGKTYDTIKTELQQIDSALEQENKKLNDLTANSITSDEYYKKRREADILKIEKENLEFGLKTDPLLTKEKQELEAKIEEQSALEIQARKLASNLPVFVSTNLDKEQFFAIKTDLLNQVVLVLAN